MKTLPLALSIFLVGTLSAQGTSVATFRADGTPSYSSQGSLSDDGRYLVYEGVKGVMLRDRYTGTTEVVSVTPWGTPSLSESYLPKISGDGSTVVFLSRGFDLTHDIVDTTFKVYVRDLNAGTTTLISSPFADDPVYGHCLYPLPSRDGRFVTYTALNAFGLNDTNDNLDVFLHDRILGTTELVSVTPQGLSGEDRSFSSFLSEDGRYVLFTSWADDLVANDTNGFADTFLRDRQTLTTTLLSRDSAGALGNGDSGAAGMTPDGAYVLISSGADNFVPNDTNQARDTFRLDMATGQMVRCTVDSSGNEGDEDAYPQAISEDGNRVLFFSKSAFHPNDLNYYHDAYLRDIAAGTTTPISRDSSGTMPLHGDSYGTGMDATGSLVSFYSMGVFLTPHYPGTWGMLFLHSLDGPILDRQGNGPGVVTFTVTGSTPGQNVALLFGHEGSYTKPAGACQGVELDISDPSLAGMAVCNSETTATFYATLPAGAHGLVVQAVDLASCGVTDPLLLQ